MKRVRIEAEPCAQLDELVRRGLASVVSVEVGEPQPLIATEAWAQELLFGEQQTAAPRTCVRRAG